MEHKSNNIPEFIKAVRKADDKITDGLTDKAERIRRIRQEASRLSAIANKRLQRLEKAGMTDSPAYKKWIDEGGQKFGVRGKDFNEVQQELSRLRRFLGSQTSTIRGINSTLKEMANNTGISYKNLGELRENAKHFFELSSKIEQYLRTVDDMASAIGYQKIWKAINQYVKKEKINLSDSEENIEDMTHKIVKAMDIYHEKEDFKAKHGNVTITGWYQLE